MLSDTLAWQPIFYLCTRHMGWRGIRLGPGHCPSSPFLAMLSSASVSLDLYKASSFLAAGARGQSVPVLGSLCVSMEDSGADLPREGACGWFGDPSNPLYCLHPRSQGHSDNPQVKEGSQGLIRTGPSQGAGNPRSRAISFIRLFCSEFTKRSPPLRFHPFPPLLTEVGERLPPAA